jgi:hypothetical protein
MLYPGLPTWGIEMVLTKAYLRYVPAGVFGVIASAKANVVFVKKPKYVGVAAVENVNIWNSKTGEKVCVLAGEKHEVTSLVVSPDEKYVTVGYNDGSVKIWDWESQTNPVTFSGHRKAVSALQYDETGIRVVSGSKVYCVCLSVCLFLLVLVYMHDTTICIDNSPLFVGYGCYCMGYSK